MSARSYSTYASPNPFAALMARAPWLVSGLSMFVAGTGFLLFDGWAAQHAPALSQSHPLVALPCVLLVVVLLSIRFWPVRHDLAVKAKSSKRRGAQYSATWSDIAQNASAALLERGFILLDDNTTWKPGANLVLSRDGRTYIVHARCWRDKRIDAQVVRELAQDIARHGASGGMLLCPEGSFTEQARQLARMHGIATLGRADLVDEIQRDHRRRSSASKPVPPAATAPMPQQRSDHEVMRPAPPATAAPAAARPQLRPDHLVNVRHDFSPTVPMTEAEQLPPAAAAPPPVFDPAEPMPAAPAQPALRPDHQVRAIRDFAPTIPMSSAVQLPRAAAAAPPVFDPSEPLPAASHALPKEDHKVMPWRAYANTASMPLTPEPARASQPNNARPDFASTVPMSMTKAGLLPRAAAAAALSPVFDPSEPQPAAPAPPRADHEIMPWRAYADTAPTPMT